MPRQRNFGDGAPPDCRLSQRSGNLEPASRKPREARSGCSSALSESARRASTPRADLVAGVVQNLAVVDATLGDYIAARREHRRAMRIWKRTLGPSHPYVAIALTDLASVMRDQGAAAEALPLLERALAIRERSLSREHRMVASTLTDLAGTLKDMGRLAQARERSDRALKIWQTIGQSDGPDFARTLDGRAELEVNRRYSASARSHYQHALDIEKGLVWAGHPVVAATQVGLAGLLAQLANHHDALDNAVQADVVTREHLRRMLKVLARTSIVELRGHAAEKPGFDVAVDSTEGPGRQALRWMNSFEAGRWCWTRWRREARTRYAGEEGAGHLRTTLNSA